MKRILLLLLAIAAVFADDKKSLPNQAGNDDVEMVATVLLDQASVQQALGADLGMGYAAVKIKITPKVLKALHFSADDFTLILRKDGERSSALSPSQIAGRGSMVVHAAKQQPGGLGTVSNGPIWGGIGGAQPRKLPGNGNGGGNSGSTEAGTADATIDTKAKEDSPLLAALKAKALPEIDSKDPVEGLLYFTFETKKLKPKDAALLYKGEAGRLVIDFK